MPQGVRQQHVWHMVAACDLHVQRGTSGMSGMMRGRRRGCEKVLEGAPCHKVSGRQQVWCVVVACDPAHAYAQPPTYHSHSPTFFLKGYKRFRAVFIASVGETERGSLIKR